MADNIGNQEIFVGYTTPLTSMRFSPQMAGLCSPGVCERLKVAADGLHVGAFTITLPFSCVVESSSWSGQVAAEAVEGKDEKRLFKVSCEVTNKTLTIEQRVGLYTVAVGFKFKYLQTKDNFGEWVYLNKTEAAQFVRGGGIIVASVKVDPDSGRVLFVNPDLADKSDAFYRNATSVYSVDAAGSPIPYDPTASGRRYDYVGVGQEPHRAFRAIYPGWSGVDWSETKFGLYDMNRPYFVDQKTFPMTVYQLPARLAHEDSGSTVVVDAGTVVDFESFRHDRMSYVYNGSYITYSYYLVGYRKTFVADEVPNGDLVIYTGKQNAATLDELLGGVSLDFLPIAAVQWTGSNVTSVIYPIVDPSNPSDVATMLGFKLSRREASLPDGAPVVKFDLLTDHDNDAVADVHAVRAEVASASGSQEGGVSAVYSGTVLADGTTVINVMARSKLAAPSGPADSGDSFIALQVEEGAFAAMYSAIRPDEATGAYAPVAGELITRRDIVENVLGRYKGVVDTEADLPAPGAVGPGGSATPVAQRNGDWYMVRSAATPVPGGMGLSVRAPGLAVWSSAPMPDGSQTGWVPVVDMVSDFGVAARFDRYTIDTTEDWSWARTPGASMYNYPKVFVVTGVKCDVSDYYDPGAFRPMAHAYNAVGEPVVTMSHRDWLAYSVSFVQALLVNSPRLRRSGEFVPGVWSIAHALVKDANHDRVADNPLTGVTELKDRALLWCSDDNASGVWAVPVREHLDLLRTVYVGDALNATADCFYRCSKEEDPDGSRSVTGAYLALPWVKGGNKGVPNTYLTDTEFDNVQPPSAFDFDTSQTDGYPYVYADGNGRMALDGYAGDTVKIPVKVVPDGAPYFVKATSVIMSAGGGAATVTADGSVYFRTPGVIDVPVELTCGFSKRLLLNIYSHVSTAVIKDSTGVVTTLTLDKSWDYGVRAGDAGLYQLYADYLPATCRPARVEWVSGDEGVASVEAGDMGGAVLRLNGEGATQVHLRVWDEGDDPDAEPRAVGVVNLQVKVSVTSIRIIIPAGHDSVNVDVGHTKQLEVEVLPPDATFKDVDWGTDNSMVATINSAGILQGRSNGSCRVWARAKDVPVGGGSPVSTQELCYVNTAVSEISITGDMVLEVNPLDSVSPITKIFTAHVYPGSATTKYVDWSITPDLAEFLPVSSPAPRDATDQPVIVKPGARAGYATISAASQSNPDVVASFSVILTRKVAVRLNELFGVDTVSDVVKAVYDQVHRDVTFFRVGDYFSFPSISVLGTVYDNVIFDDADRTDWLRVEVVDVDGFYGVNGVRDHQVTFQFRNAFLSAKYDLTMDLNSGGYARTNVRQFLTGNVFRGIVAAGVPEYAVLAPSRRISRGEIQPNGVNVVQDKIWIPTVHEVMGGHAQSLGLEADLNIFLGGYAEHAGDRAYLTRYVPDTWTADPADPSVKRWSKRAVEWWLASPVWGTASNYCAVDVNGNLLMSGGSGGRTATADLALAPCFCIG